MNKTNVLFVLFLACVLLIPSVSPEGQETVLSQSSVQPSLLWKFEKIILHGVGIAITPDGSKFHVVRGHLRGVKVASSTVCSVNDEECLERNGEHKVEEEVRNY